jgi:nucleoside-diphosphate-sugar epimerase
MSHVLLFGASGFIGRYVRRALLVDPAVTAITCPGRDRYDLVRGDLAGLTELIRETAPAAVVNCTGQLAGTGYDLVAANTSVTAKLIEAVATAAPDARLIRLGSASEYGTVAPGRAVAEDAPTVPVSEYGVSHLAGTRLLELASNAGRVDGVVLRVFNPIGAGLSEENLLGRAAALLTRAVRTGERVVELGPLDAYRDFVDVRDVASAVVAAALVPGPLPARVFNVASGTAVTAREVVALLAAAAGFTGEIHEGAPAPVRSVAVPWIQGDIGLAARVLGWAPEYQLVDSVKAVIGG